VQRHNVYGVGDTGGRDAVVPDALKHKRLGMSGWASGDLLAAGIRVCSRCRARCYRGMEVCVAMDAVSIVLQGDGM